MNETIEGIKMEASQQIKETSGCPEGSKLLQEAMDNICATWQSIADLITDLDKDAPLTKKILLDASHPVPKLLLQLYSYECYLYKTLNHALRFGDESKVDSLGPYNCVMRWIVDGAISSREDELDEEKFEDLNLYRGTCLTDAQIK